jgi:hypothetical protein
MDPHKRTYEGLGVCTLPRHTATDQGIAMLSILRLATAHPHFLSRMNECSAHHQHRFDALAPNAPAERPFL